MSKFIPKIPAIVSVLISTIFVQGLLIFLGKNKIYPQVFVAEVFGVAKIGVIDYPGITLMLIGIAAFIGLLFGPPIYEWASAKFISRNPSAKKYTDTAGRWDGSSFVYDRPSLVFAKRVKVEDNFKPFVFNVPDPEVNTFVNYVIEVDRANDRVHATVDFKHGKNAAQMVQNIRGGGASGGIRLPEDKLLSLVVYLKPDSSPSIVRVYITSYEV